MLGFPLSIGDLTFTVFPNLTICKLDASRPPAAISGRVLPGVVTTADLQAKPYAVTNYSAPDRLERMIREISAGGVVVRPSQNGWEMAAIEPQKAAPGAVPVGKQAQGFTKNVTGFAQRLGGPGRKPDQTAIREVREETGLTAQIVTKLKDIKYAYVRSWGDQQRVFKIVSFYLLKYQSGEIDDIDPAMRIEVKRAIWIPLTEAASKLLIEASAKWPRLLRRYLNRILEA